MNHWETVVQSPSNDIFSSNCTDFKNKSHIERAWMSYQVPFVRCFADEHIHLGMRVTSRAGGSHAIVKKYINLAKVELLTVQQQFESDA
jgi:hypothetical protein